ncbi:protein abnormal spindle [Pieris brassicae]|uniref:protein abnormal spindle n=1 Tax=Pieris brassicae TaxID=7116 RepID=UPI001E66100F|nr:protein abnormal spindle [Pieris brassicae]
MFFQIENTPERIRKARKPKVEPQASPKEECPRLTLAPFTRPPKLLFENVVVGTSCERYLELFNPSKEHQVITLNKSLPGLHVDMPEGRVLLDSESCYCLTLIWTPLEVISCRETLRFSNEKRGRFDIVVVLKSILPVKSKAKPSPGKIKKKILKRSPGNICKKKVQLLKKETSEIMKTVNITQTKYKVLVTNSDAEFRDSPPIQNPFETDDTESFNTSEIFPNKYKQPAELYTTYDKPSKNEVTNILKASNKQNLDNSISDLFDNITFTPLKSLPSKVEKLDKGPKIVCSINSVSDYDDSLDPSESNKENEVHSIVCIATSNAGENRWSYTQPKFIPEFATPKFIEKKIPKTSSPKDMNSPNFSINTDYSRISDTSFFPQRFSTERKSCLKLHSENHDLDDHKLNTDTFTKESPLEQNINQIDTRHLTAIEPRMCRQALFRDQENRLFNERNMWQSDFRSEMRSPPRSISPPLQSIPEESMQFSETFERNNPHMETFAINRTYNKPEKSMNKSSVWSKKAIVKSKPSLHFRESISKVNHTFISNKSTVQNLSLSYVPNAYSQSLVTNPFSSLTPFCDEALIRKFEKDFKDWLNYILTPPDLETNIEQKIDIAKVWVENKNDVPTAPTKEKVCSSYHNSHRLDGLRKSARTLLNLPEITAVIKKLNLQIDRELITIREDRSIHLNVGLQKTIMEIILSYNPLWLRIGLEVIYNCILPLKSNSDIVGLTTFVVQRMFRNPLLKNKKSKSAPNMQHPAYVDAVKKSLLKKFFLLVYFLDKAKEKKLISHDPCLFRRNALCKESREILIRFTRELIAAIGDINKHLRPTGYVVTHKQTYLDEYKYGVNNIAVDLRDGVRLTKVSEIILLKENLMKQLRTPAISRFQKIHNVDVALKALRLENFSIEGEITATDVADGHREKTLSLLWQLIHVFRAPLFEKAANVIQMWWRKKYEVIKEKRRIEEEEMKKTYNAASIIQSWWRQIQNKRRYEERLYEVTRATIILQKYCRMWLCRTYLVHIKRSVLNIETWYQSMKLIREAKAVLCQRREKRRQKSAILIQSQMRRWICMKKYQNLINCTVKIQTLLRKYLARRQYLELRAQTVFIQKRYRNILLTRRLYREYTTLKEATVTLQRSYRAQLLMRQYRTEYNDLRNAVIIIQKRYLARKRMQAEKSQFDTLKRSCVIIQRRFRANCLGKEARTAYIKQRHATIKIQANYKAWKIRREFLRLKRAVLTVQRRYRAQRKMHLDRSNYILQRNACIIIQRFYRAYRLGNATRSKYLKERNASLKIQDWYRSCRKRQFAMQEYIAMRNSVITVQRRFRAQKKMIPERCRYVILINACITIQRLYLARKLGREARTKYLQQRIAIIKIQTCYRAWKARQEYTRLKQAVIIFQRRYKAQREMRQERSKYIIQRNSCISIQRFYRAYKLGDEARCAYLKHKKAAIKIQAFYRAWKGRQRYMSLKQAVMNVQSRFRAQRKMQMYRTQYFSQRTACLSIQNFYRSYRLGKQTRATYHKQRIAAIRIQDWYRSCKLSKKSREEYLVINQAVITIQRRYKAHKTMCIEKSKFDGMKRSSLVIQRYFRAYRLGKETRKKYLTHRNAALNIQNWYRSCRKTQQIRNEYIRHIQAAVTLQRQYRAQKKMHIERLKYHRIKNAAITLQKYYQAYRLGKQAKTAYLQQRNAAKIIQHWYRNWKTCNKIKVQYQEKKKACVTIQTTYRSYIITKKQREQYIQIREATIYIQRFYRSYKETKLTRQYYLSLISSVLCVQRIYRSLLAMRKARIHYLLQKKSAIIIQERFKNILAMRKQRAHFLELKTKAIILQACVRGFIERRKYQTFKTAVITIQCIYRLRMTRKLIQQNKQEKAAICIQKNWRRYVAINKYKIVLQRVVLIQRLWRGMIVMRPIRREFLFKRELITKIQAQMRGYLVRKHYENKKEYLKKEREEQRQHWAASKIQALYKGHKVRSTSDKCMAEIRQRWREGKLHSTQRSLAERIEEAFNIFRTDLFNITAVLEAFRTLELTIVLWPESFAMKATLLIQSVFYFMACTNRSISSVEMLMSGATFLVNLARYHVTGPKSYQRDRISAVLKYMLRFSNIEPNLICRFATYIWLYSKYEFTKKDLTKFLQIPENHKTLIAIKNSTSRMKKMAANSTKPKLTQTPNRSFTPNEKPNFNMSLRNVSRKNTTILPNLNPDYGIERNDKPRFFLDPEQAIECIFMTYNL